MCKTVVISVSLNKALLNQVDAYLKAVGCGAHRSAFVNEAMAFYMKWLSEQNENI